MFLSGPKKNQNQNYYTYFYISWEMVLFLYLTFEINAMEDRIKVDFLVLAISFYFKML